MSSGGHLVQQNGNVFSNLCRRSHKKHFCEIILKSVHWSRRSCHFKGFLVLALVAILFRGAKHLSNFGRGSFREHFCELFQTRAIGLGGDVI